MILIIGLGNPGKQYELTRHNVGFMAVDRIAGNFKAGSFSKFNAEIFQFKYGQAKLMMAKPLTFMNNSGSVVAALLKHYDIQTGSLLVMHDDMDIELGNIRFKSGGSTAGHKGLESIVKATGSQRFNRLRIGIGRPPGSQDPADYVLEPFSLKETEELEFVFNTVSESIEDYLESGLDYVMNKYN